MQAQEWLSSPAKSDLALSLSHLLGESQVAPREFIFLSWQVKQEEGGVWGT